LGFNSAPPAAADSRTQAARPPSQFIRSRRWRARRTCSACDCLPLAVVMPLQFSVSAAARVKTVRGLGDRSCSSILAGPLAAMTPNSAAQTRIALALLPVAHQPIAQARQHQHTWLSALLIATKRIIGHSSLRRSPRHRCIAVRSTARSDLAAPARAPNDPPQASSPITVGSTRPKIPKPPCA
jgi:hypothetical protein